ncbi:endolytic transglycosylase MltG [Candidatus Dojkabacteria bacterium]|jgi:UPF0755 protein|nr:endolytic transglycosylase MltG [Candidatus Dojkabacteria bacterium]
MKNFIRFLSVLFFLILASAIVLFFGYKKILSTPIGSNSTKQLFAVEKGTTGYEVLSNLVGEKIITKTQELALKIYIKLNGSPAIKEGTYKIPLNITPTEIMSVLENPDVTDIWITIPEGLRADQIAQLISNEYKTVSGSVFSDTEFMKNFSDKAYITSLNLGIETKTLEGFLFPDTYFLPAQATTDYVIRTLVGNFKKKAEGVSYKNLIIASLVEKEGITDTDRAMIADVINKRLKEGWTLGLDVTLLYYYKDWKRDLSEADLKFDEPYNTRIKTGLPPTPICNPGMSSINAALKPKANSYYYFIAAHGKVYFAKNVTEHNANIAKYLN